jgi:hypothetical protein
MNTDANANGAACYWMCSRLGVVQAVNNVGRIVVGCAACAARYGTPPVGRTTMHTYDLRHWGSAAGPLRPTGRRR